jgi:hypothetical protein
MGNTSQGTKLNRLQQPSHGFFSSVPYDFKCVVHLHMPWPLPQMDALECMIETQRFSVMAETRSLKW